MKIHPARRTAVAFCLLAILLFTGLSTAGLITAGLFTAGSAAADTTSDQFADVELEVIDSVSWQSGVPVRSKVTVETDRAVSGTLTVVSEGEGQPRTTYEFDLDLAAGSTVTLQVDLFTGWNGAEGTATLTSNGEAVATNTVRAFGQGDQPQSQVAVYGIPSPPQRLEEIGGDEQLQTLVLDRTLRGLDRASTLVITPGTFNEFGGDSAEWLAVEAWVRGGGQLIVAGPADSLPDGFHTNPTANQNRYDFGAGSILYSETWEDGVPLGGYVGASGLRELVQQQNLGVGASGELAILAGISLPSARTVAIVLLVYSLIAGPLLFGVLAARRMHGRMWVALPALSGLFVVAILGFGFLSRSGRSDTHITIVEVNESGSRATSNVLLTSSFGGGRSIETPATWAYLGQGQSQSQRPVKIRFGSTATEILLDTPPGSSSVTRVRGVAPEYDGMLRIHNIRYQDGQVLADVTNTSDADLSEVIAMVGNAREPIDDLPAGATVSFSVAAADDFRRTMQELLTWPRVRNEWSNNGVQVAVPENRDAATSAGAWTEWRTEQGSAALPLGTVGVVGWTDDLDGPVADVGQGRTALFVRENVPTDVRQAIGFSVVGRLPSRQVEPRFDGNFQGYLEPYRVTLSEGVDVSTLAVQVSRESAGMGFLTTDGWRYPNLQDGEVLLAIPDNAVIDGEVTLRSFVVPWNNNSGLTLAMMEAEGQKLPLQGEPQYRNMEGFGFEPPPVQEGLGGLRNLEEGQVVVIEWGDGAGTDTDNEAQYTGSVDGGTFDLYTVTLEDGDTLTATMSSVRGDSYLEVVEPSGELGTSNDDYGRGVDSQIQYTTIESGEYQIRAQGLSGESMDYVLVVEVNP